MSTTLFTINVGIVDALHTSMQPAYRSEQGWTFVRIPVAGRADRAAGDGMQLRPWGPDRGAGGHLLHPERGLPPRRSLLITRCLERPVLPVPTAA